MEYKNKIKSFDKAFAYAVSKNGKLLTFRKDYKSDKRCKWLCENNHIFESTFGNLVNFERWCVFCSGTAKFGIEKYTINDACKLAESRGGKCLSKKYVNSHQYLEWQCKNGHIWKAKFYLVKNLNNWCRKCSGSEKHTLQDMQNYAKEKNGKCLSITYKDNKQKLLWECESGHQWLAKFNTISSCDSWCPECKLWKTQKQIYKIVQDICGPEKCFFNYREFEWLRLPDTKYPMEIDIFIKNYNNKNIAIEYHGEQHFRAVKYFGGQKSFERVKFRDKIKKELIEQHSEEVDKFVVLTNGDDLSAEGLQYILDNIIQS